MNLSYGYETIKCPDCSSNPDVYQDVITDTAAGEVICRNCGVVLGERLIDDGAEWRTFNNDDTLYGNKSDPNRCGGAVSPLQSGESGLNTFISGGKDSKEMRHLQKIQGVAMKNSYAEKKLQERYKNVEEFADQLNLTKTTREHACLILHHLNAKGKFKDKKGATGRRIALAALYHANNQCGGGQGVKRFCEVFSDMVTLHSFNKAKKYVEMHMERSGTASNAPTSVRGADFVPRICTELVIKANVTLAAKDIARSATEDSLVDGMRPRAVAAAAVLLACSACAPGKWREPDACSNKVSGVDKKSKVVDSLQITRVAEVAGIGKPSVLKAYKVLYAARANLFTEAFLASVAVKGNGEGKGSGGGGDECSGRSIAHSVPYVA